MAVLCAAAERRAPVKKERNKVQQHLLRPCRHTMLGGLMKALFKVIQGHRFWYQLKAHMRLPISD